MEPEELKFNLPDEYVEALRRRHDGRKLEPAMIAGFKERMDHYWLLHCKAGKSLEKLWKFWDKKNVEDHFEQPIWYNAHARRKKYTETMLKNHRAMFYLLLQADGNYEEFSQYHCISAEEIKYDFYKKYV